MTTPARFVVVSALVLLAGSSGFAQPPVAPPPHPPLRELVKEYVRLGLPLPPTVVPLVKIRRTLRNGDDDSTEIKDLLGFPRTPVAIGRDPRYLVGSGRIWTLWIPPHTVEPVDPTSACLRLPSQMDGHGFPVLPPPIQCPPARLARIRGPRLCQGAGNDLSGLSRGGTRHPQHTPSSFAISRSNCARSNSISPVVTGRRFCGGCVRRLPRSQAFEELTTGPGSTSLNATVSPPTLEAGNGGSPD